MKISSVLFLLALALAVLLWRGGTPAAAAPQATFTVNTKTDLLDAQPGNGKCESGIGNGVCSLRAAIMETNALAGADIILLPAGTYVLTRVGDDGTALNGDLDIKGSLGIYGAGALSTSINGNGTVTHDRVLHILYDATASIFDLSITGGVTTGLGGGIHNEGTLALTNTIVSFNSSEYHGGGITSWGPLILTKSVVSGNKAEYSGGGIFSNAMLRLTESTISGNRAKGSGGGVWSNSATTYTNSTISGNRSDGKGGGIYALGNNVFLNNVTIASNIADDDNNDADDGGGIYNNDSSIHIQNTIIANNVHRSSSTPLPLPDDCKGTALEGHHLLIETLTGCTVDGNTTHNITGQDPQLGPLQNNGGPTQTHALNANSPAIDAGSNGCDELFVGQLTTDQRGAPRHVDGDNNRSAICDIGAFEYGGGSTNPTPTATKTPTNQPPVTATHTPTSSNGCTTKPGTPVLTAPAHNKTVNKVMVKLDWEDVPCATKYKVMVRQDAKNGPIADKKTVTASKHKTGTLQIGHVHYWFVKACNDHGCAKSETRTFTTMP